MLPHHEQLSRIRGKLQQVRRAAPDTFGAGSHRYRLGQPAEEGVVAAFEQKHGIELPSCYRAFITQIGYRGRGKHGGAGPYYGLFGLEGWSDYPEWIFDDVEDDWMARASPLRPGKNLLPELTLEEELDDDWPPRIIEKYHGMMTIGTRGCTYCTGLVVTGECRGRVVYVEAGQAEPPYVSRDATFLDWYERWLDELLAGYDTTWFGYGPSGGESELLEIIETSSDDELVREAVSNLGKLPTRTDAVWRAMTGVTESPLVDHRRTAAWLIGRAPVGVVHDFLFLLDDPHVSVRKQAYLSFLNVSVETFGPAVRDRVASEDNDSAREAAEFGLRRAGLID